MIAVSRERGEQEAVTFWQYVLACLDKLGYEGMSDEEGGEEILYRRDGTAKSNPVKHVLLLYWRHPSFRSLFQRVDETHGIEDEIFKHQNRPKVPRIRVDVQSKRGPPKHLQVAFFRQEYLDSLYSHEREELFLSEKHFQLFDYELPAAA
ncbi:hypothetical protein BDZ89DRAFT_953783 [Hymenopellis radicata]|nr:hypothetical protein BDZ89DRAFT_953783 [Hymenopellis radicata]